MVGGDCQGANPDTLNAEHVFVCKDVKVSTNATEKGDAGKVIFWADGYTRMYGTVDAKGGEFGGDGGFVEVSGKKAFDFGGHTDRSSPKGIAGELLLDPESDITIAPSPPPPPPQGSFVGGFFFPSLATSNVTAATIDAELAGGDVTISTANGVGGSPFGGRITMTDDGISSGSGNTLNILASEDFIMSPDATIDGDIVINVQCRNFTMNTSAGSGVTLATTLTGNRITTIGNMTLTGIGAATAEIILPGCELNIGGNLTLLANGGTADMDMSSSPSSWTIGGNFNMTSMQAGDSVIAVYSGNAPSGHTVSVAGDINITSNDPTSSNRFTIFATGSQQVMARNINITGTGTSMRFSADMNVNVIANESINLGPGALLESTGPPRHSSYGQYCRG